MKKSRTASPAGEALASPPVATVQVPLRFSLCLEAGKQVLRTLMKQDRARLCGPKNVLNPEHRAYRGESVRGEVTLGGRRIIVPRLRARNLDGTIQLASFAYSAASRLTPARWMRSQSASPHTIITAHSTRCSAGSMSVPSPRVASRAAPLRSRARS